MIKTHHGLIAEFSRRLVQQGSVEAVLVRDLNRVQTMRLAADYSCEPPPLAEAKMAVAQAEAFVAAIANLVSPVE